MSHHKYGPTHTNQPKFKYGYELAMGGISLCIMAIALCITLFCANQEAKIFNKFKSDEVPSATLWDALFSELRVETRGDK